MRRTLPLCLAAGIQVQAGFATPLPEPSTEQIIAEARLDLLRDEPYYHPVRPDPLAGETYVRLRKWDLVFTGPLPEHAGNINNIIPGRYDHTLAYVGKDSRGYAYFVELNVNSLVDLEGIRMFSPGTDFGDAYHPSGDRFWSDYGIEFRWAKTFREDVRSTILAADGRLSAQVMIDLRAQLPYQMPAALSANTLISRKIHLIDDGNEDGAGCTDYWTNLFEDQANVCFHGVRFGADDFIDYVLNDPAGQLAYIPDEVNPLPLQLTGRDLLDMGFVVVEDVPHVFRCGGEPEAGLVLADLVIDSPLLEDPPTSSAPPDARYLIDAIEYYHRGLDRYLVTNRTEAERIDSGVAGPGWLRTGKTFKVWSHPRGGAVAVSRFFTAGTQAHFLTLDAGERDFLRSLNPSNVLREDAWMLEGITFYLHAPTNGTCPEATVEIHRMFKHSTDSGPSHRYMVDETDVASMLAAGWQFEGLAMCAPR